jgi:hypothetical protein
MEENPARVKAMLKIVNQAIKDDSLEFLATLLAKLQQDYEEIAMLSTDGNYQPNWTHKQVLDYLTYEQKF